MLKRGSPKLGSGSSRCPCSRTSVTRTERQTKLRLAYAIDGIIASVRLNQSEAAIRRGVGRPKISALARYKLAGFSVEGLMTFLTTVHRKGLRFC
jgi:predicted XRE-type DNA-binding protein